LETVSYTLSNVSETVSQILNVRVVLNRINAFMKEDNLEKYTVEPEDHLRSKGWIGIRNGYFCYYGSQNTSDVPITETTPLLLESSTAPNNEHNFELKDISINFPLHSLSVIVGTTGAGKTSILLTLLGEMKRNLGEYSIPEHHLGPHPVQEKSDVVYAPQSPWLMSATIRENILFGEEYDEARYYQVVKACALLKDLQTLEYGDKTEIGEKGVNLSGIVLY
jgi:ABC-type transport system involved in cytochrome bd biosynthesis fused ATPase/permease subunit